MVQTFGVYTRYLGPTNHRGSRIKVTLGGRSKTVPYDYSASDAHESAIREALGSWGYELYSVKYVCPTESGRGSVYSVPVA